MMARAMPDKVDRDPEKGEVTEGKSPDTATGRDIDTDLDQRPGADRYPGKPSSTR